MRFNADTVISFSVMVAEWFTGDHVAEGGTHPSVIGAESGAHLPALARRGIVHQAVNLSPLVFFRKVLGDGETSGLTKSSRWQYLYRFISSQAHTQRRPAAGSAALSG